VYIATNEFNSPIIFDGVLLRASAPLFNSHSKQNKPHYGAEYWYGPAHDAPWWAVTGKKSVSNPATSPSWRRRRAYCTHVVRSAVFYSNSQVAPFGDGERFIIYPQLPRSLSGFPPSTRHPPPGPLLAKPDLKLQLLEFCEEMNSASASMWVAGLLGVLWWLSMCSECSKPTLSLFPDSDWWWLVLLYLGFQI